MKVNIEALNDLFTQVSVKKHYFEKLHKQNPKNDIWEKELTKAQVEYDTLKLAMRVLLGGN